MNSTPGSLPPGSWAPENDVVVIRVPNAMFANHLEGEYRDRILRAFAATGSPMASIRCSVSPNSHAAPGGVPTPSEEAAYSPGMAGGLSVADDASPGAHRTPNGEPIRPALRSDPVSASFSFDSFVVGASNRFAHSAALDVSNPGVGYSPYNPLLLHGEAGLGKTHLLHAQRRSPRVHAADNNTAGARSSSPGGDTLHAVTVISAVRSNDLYGFRTECARNSTCCWWTTSSSSPASIALGRVAEEFFHALTALSDRGRPIVPDFRPRPAGHPRTWTLRSRAAWKAD